MNIPPVIGMVIALIIGILLGAGGMYQHYSKEVLKIETKVRSADNKAGRDIAKETATIKKESTVKHQVVKYRDKIVKVKTELSDEELDSLCINRFAPADIVQSIRDEIDRARRRTNCLSVP